VLAKVAIDGRSGVIISSQDNVLYFKEYWSQPARNIVRRYRQRQQQQALVTVSDANSDDLALTRSLQLHECGYPDCGKQFRHKQHLLRHQTQKHGRTPTRFLGLQQVWMRPDDMNSTGQSYGSAGVFLKNTYIIFLVFYFYVLAA